MSTLERVIVSRKTPGDGKLEISPELAQALGGQAAEVTVRVAGATARGVVSEMQCTCAKAAAQGVSHVHHFVQCEAFHDLTVGLPLELRGEPGRLDVV